ncbi:hypothetical protein [Sulfuracidifex metallicus]|nr:hypothetical protein [Sulfuracidifex metallicus]WOE51733.1 hypothetical protein RQ359_001061 [Sulfuracidifex metallicus DSM 6482 = JCM 9184]
MVSILPNLTPAILFLHSELEGLIFAIVSLAWKIIWHGGTAFKGLHINF